jgi:uncharacterized protein (DUF2062 family)
LEEKTPPRGAESFEAALVKQFLKTRLVDPIVALLTQGITPKKIAMSVAIGVVVGCFPLLGTTTTLCTIAAVVFGLNLPAIQLVNYLVYPLQLFLLIPFVRLGEMMVHAHAQPLNAHIFVAYAKEGPRVALSKLGSTAVHAVAGWLLIAPIALVLIYAGLLPVITRMAKSMNAAEAD